MSIYGHGIHAGMSILKSSNIDEHCQNEYALHPEHNDNVLLTVHTISVSFKTFPRNIKIG
jgi:hypothetical protein